MYITKFLAGRPFQCYVPEPLVPPIPAHYLRFFGELDRRLSSSLHQEAFMANMALAVVQPNNKLNSSLALKQAQLAAEKPLNTASIKQLLKANAALLGLPSSEFRTKLAWLGAAHPGLSWHVGSPPEMLPTLVKRLFDEISRLDSSSLAAVILLFRLLQIHPFVDGNGRTSRYWSIRHIHRSIGPSDLFLSLINSLWDRKNFDINAVSLSAQQEESLDPIFQCIEERSDFENFQLKN